MQAKTHHKTFLSTLLLSGFLLAACSGDSGGGGGSTSATPGAGADEPNEGLYQANLGPLNNRVAGATSGTALVRVNNKFATSLLVNNSPGSIAHRQYITSGTRCPTAADDTNADGYLDSVEIIKASGNYLIPLDSNLETQASGGKYPIATQAGSYFYNQEANLDTVLADLYKADPNPSDNTIKLPPESSLNLAGRVIIIQSVRSNLVFPSTVAGGDSTVHRTLPIACGVLARVDTSTPFPLPGPVAAWPWQTSFGTRLSPELAISGFRCKGTETTQVIVNGQEATITCPAGKWLVTVDNLNRCSPEGQCTEIAVSPIVTDLIKSTRPSAATLAFYNLIPRSPASVDQTQIMKKHWVRFDTNGEPLVLEK